MNILLKYKNENPKTFLLSSGISNYIKYKKNNKKGKKAANNKKTAHNSKNCIKFYIIIIFIIILIILISAFIFKFRDNKIRNNENFNITELIESKTDFNNTVCHFIKRKLKNRKQPFDYEEELSFFISLILCKIPFSFIRFADGEESIMAGKSFNFEKDKWFWNNTNQKFQKSLIESTSICLNQNNFIAIPCKNWENVSKSILSFSKCDKSKYMSFTTVFYNKNFQFFQNWINEYIHSSNRWKIILVANSLINKDISWAYKFFPIPDHIVEKWDEISDSLLTKLADEAKQNNLIFLVSTGPAANIIISYLIKINNKNIYIDFGSAIELITKGFSTRLYSKNQHNSLLRCEPFYLENKNLIYIG